MNVPRKVVLGLSGLATTGIVMACFLGCGGDNEVKAADDAEAAALTQLVDNVPEYAGRMLVWPKLWVDGAMPTDKETMKWYEEHTLLVMKPLMIEGNTATLNISSYDAEQNEIKHKWTAVKEGDEWKLKEAPITPAAPE